MTVVNSPDGNAAGMSGNPQSSEKSQEQKHEQSNRKSCKKSKVEEHAITMWGTIADAYSKFMKEVAKGQKHEKAQAFVWISQLE